LKLCGSRAHLPTSVWPRRTHRARRLYRLWDEPQTASLQAAQDPEILSADLAVLFSILRIGVSLIRPRFSFLIKPPRAALAEARSLLVALGAIDGDGRMTDMGRQLRQLPLPPRLGPHGRERREIREAARAAEIALLLTEAPALAARCRSCASLRRAAA